MISFDNLRWRLSGGRYEHVRELYELIRPLEFAGLRKQRIGNPAGDGGYVMAADFDSISAALSLGIGNDITWDVEMASHGIHIYQFDHTVSAPVEVDSNPFLHFYPIGISGCNEDSEQFQTIEHILRDILKQHMGDLILKIDIDGYEWESFSEMHLESLLRFRQICVEFHNPLGRPAQARNRKRNLSVLRKLYEHFAPIHLHMNNVGRVRMLSGYPVPKLLEVTYVRRDERSFLKSEEIFPTSLDFVTDPSKPEIPVSKILDQVLASKSR